MISYISEAMSRKQIREYAFKARKFFGLENAIYIPVVVIWESLPVLFPEISCEIVYDEEFSENIHGETDVLNHTVKIKESVYNGACAGSGQHRMTIIHEIAHYLMLCVSGVKLQRNFGQNIIKAYHDPEWQAKCFAGEFMIPYHLVGSMSARDVVQKCGVSYDAACYQLTKIS